MAQMETRIMYVWPEGGELTPVLPLIRMGRGMMMGVDHNRDLQWSADRRRCGCKWFSSAQKTVRLRFERNRTNSMRQYDYGVVSRPRPLLSRLRLHLNLADIR